MSLSCRKAVSYALVASLGGVPAAWAQQTYFVPKIETSAEYNTNREMFADDDQTSASGVYKIDVDTSFGYKTPTTETEIRPRAQLQEFPDRSGVDPLGLFLDARSRRKTERMDLDFLARFQRQDTFYAEYGQAQFDEFDPTNPNTEQTGIVLIGNTRTSYSARPKMRYNLTERTLIGGEVSYERVTYESDLANSRVGYKSPYAEVTFIHDLQQRTEIEIGPYATRYESDDGDRTDSVGAVLGLRREWSEISRADLRVRFESSDIQDADTPGVEQSTSNFGLEFIGYRRNRVGFVRYSLGRFLSPSGLGSRRETDQARIEYNRPMTPRASWGGSVRLMQDRSIDDDASSSDDRNRAYGELYVTFSMTREWYLRGGYRYAYLDDKNSTVGAAQNHAAFLTFGFQGLSPPGRFRQSY